MNCLSTDRLNVGSLDLAQPERGSDLAQPEHSRALLRPQKAVKTLKIAFNTLAVTDI